MAGSQIATLVSIPASNFVEKARWALQFAGVPFVESKFAPLLVYSSTVPKGGRSVPLLQLPPSAGGKALTDSADILDFCAEAMPELYPTAGTKALERKYDTELGPFTRCIAYHLVFMDSTAARRVLTGPLGFFQSWLAWLLFPLLRAALMRALKVNAVTAEKSWARVEKIVADAEKRLGDGPVGSRFLDGDAFSAADITFCAHMSLLLLPPEHAYISPHFSVDRVRDAMFQQRLAALRVSKVGQFVFWCYANKRPPMVPLRSKL